MSEVPSHHEVYLNPGEFYFGEGDIRITTVLGSCVSITLWHPKHRHGGMCHFILDSRGVVVDHLDGKYADEAIELFMNELAERKTSASEYVTKVFGGGNMFATTGNVPGMDIGGQNVEAAHRLLQRRGFCIAAENVGGNGHRRMMFDLWNGDVWMRFQPSQTNGRDNK